MATKPNRNSNTEKSNVIQISSKIKRNFTNIKLTKRELEVLNKIVLGYTAKEIGQFLNISYRTVEAYIDTLKFKLGCHSKREIIAMAITTGLIFKLDLLEK